METNKIYCSDNREVMSEIPTGSVELIYVDAPFDSVYSHKTFDHSMEKAIPTLKYQDQWTESLNWIRPRVIEMRRILKVTGSLYYHCDTRISGVIRSLLDEVFGVQQFRNEIVLKRRGLRSSLPGNRFPEISDRILFYAKDESNFFKPQFTESEPFRPGAFPYIELPDGSVSKLPEDATDDAQAASKRFSLVSLSASQSTPAFMFSYKGYHPPKNGWRLSLSKIQALDAAGKLFFPASSSEQIRMKRYAVENTGVPVGDVWTDITSAGIAERLGYATQKPIALLKRIIQSSTRENDIVLDPFCGSGTTMQAAQELGRNWIGIDISPTACRVSATRLTNQCHLVEGDSFHVVDSPLTVEELVGLSPLDFESWVITALNRKLIDGQCRSESSQTAYEAHGADVVITPKAEKPVQFLEIPVIIKQKRGVEAGDLQHTIHGMHRLNRRACVVIAFDFTLKAEEISNLSQPEDIRINLMTVAQLLERTKNIAIDSLIAQEKYRATK